MKTCPHCGAELKEEELFCGYCGQEVIIKNSSRVKITYSDSTGLIPNLGVFIDGRKAMDIGLSETVEINLESGEHVFFVKEEFSESPRKKFTLEPGEELRLGIRAKSSNSIGGMYYMFFNPKNHFVLERLDTPPG